MMVNESETPAGEGGADAQAPSPGPMRDELSIYDVVDYFESLKSVNLNQQETERQRFLKSVREGTFPAPVKPRNVLPRPEAGGDVDWSDCFWAPADIKAWVEDTLDKEETWNRWKALKVKKYLDFASLASFIARKVRRSDEEWEHWADRYKPRAFTGTFLKWAIWAVLCSWFFLSFIQVIAGPSFETRTVAGVQVLADDQPIATENTPDPTAVYEETDIEEPLYIEWGYQFDHGTGKMIVGNPGRDIANVEYATRLDPTMAERDKASGDLITERWTSAIKEGGEDAPHERYGWDLDDDGDLDYFPPLYVERDQNGNWVRVFEPRVKLKVNEDEEIILDEDGNPVLQFPFYHFITADPVPLILVLVLAGLPGLVLLWKFLNRWIALSYTLTDHRLIVRQGLLMRRESQVRTIQIKDLSAHQGIVQMLLNVGDVVVFSDDMDDPELTLEGVRNPRAVKDRIYKVSETEKKDKGWSYIEGGGQRPVPPPDR